MIPLSYQIILIISCIASTLAGSYSIAKRKMPGSKIGGVLILHGAAWSFIYILQIYAKHNYEIIHFYKIQTMMGLMIPALFSIYIMYYLELKIKSPPQAIIGVLFVPLISAFQVVLNDPFNQIWNQMTVIDNNQVMATFGPYGQLTLLFKYITMTITILFFLHTLIKPQQILKTRNIAFMISVLIYATSYSFELFMRTPNKLMYSSIVFNLLSSGIMLLSPENMYKRDVLPVVNSVVMEKMTNPVVVTDSKEKIIFLNEAAKKLLNIEKIQFLQQDIRDEFNELYNFTQLITNEKESFEYNNSKYQVGIYTVNDWRQVQKSKIHVLDDVTELVNYSKNLETLVDNKTQELRMAERMADIGKMTSMVGHDLRNPLQVIRLINGKMMNDLAGDKKIYEMTQRVNRNIIYMDKIVSDLQLLAKPRTPNRRNACLQEFIEKALENLQIPAKIDLDCECSNDIQIFIDVDMFERVIVNLVNNAIQAMPEGGKIRFDHKNESGFDIISVQDTGIGIKAEDLNTMFTPFFTTKAKGMGLGLAVCKQIVGYHRGLIWVESVKGEGAVFKIKIPSKETQYETVNETDPQSPFCQNINTTHLA